MKLYIKHQVLILPGKINYKGTKSVVEFLVNNYTIVDAGGNRDTKKVVKCSFVVEKVEKMAILGGGPLCTTAKLLYHLLFHPNLHVGNPCLLHLHDPHR